MTPDTIMEWCGVALGISTVVFMWGALGVIGYAVYKHFKNNA